VTARWFAALLVGAAAAQAQPLVIDNDPEPAAPVPGIEQQAAISRAGSKGVFTMRASSVTVRGRWAGDVPLPLARCDLLTPERISETMNALRVAVTAPDAPAALAGGTGEIEVLWIDVDFVDLQPGTPGECDGAPTAGVVLRPLHLRVSMERLGDNVLPLARDALGTAYAQVPAPLRALNPGVTLTYDEAFGTALGVTLRAPLPAVAAGLDAHAELQKSVDANYYLVDAGASWRVPHAGSALTEHRLRLAGTQRRAPLGQDVRELKASDLGGGITLKLAPTSRLWFDTGWQTGQDDISRPNAPREVHDFDQWTSRLLVDRLFADSLTYVRAALWHQNVRFDDSDRSTRFAAALGLSREVRLAPGRLIGIEAGLSFGRASDDTPSERRFRGGGPAVEFLHGGVQSPALLSLPAGPVLRSFGYTQAQLGSAALARGGTRYWSASANVALPVSRWYRPLIPDESTELQIVDDQPPLTLKQMLMNQVNVTGPNMLAAELMRQGVPADEADARARASLAEIQPAVRYLVEDAPIFALRPLLMLDVAGLGDGSTSSNWVAVGLGAQLQLATARFEGGYMQTVSGPVANQPRGSLVFRLSFQNLF
jgi:hypothetical protein